jgi:hypothetical protein
MSSRSYIIHTVSNTAPTAPNLGDEYYNPNTNKLFKALAINGTTVINGEIPVTSNPTSFASTVSVAGLLSGSTLSMTGNSTLPLINGTSNIFFTANSNTLQMQMLTSSKTLAITGNTGQLFSVTDSMTGTIYSVNDASGIPSLEILSSGLVKIAQYTGNVMLGTGSDFGYKLYVNGSFAATTKSFVIDHPTKPGMSLRYACLEGPENGVYVRGRQQDLVIELPDYWTGLVDEFTITVNLTPIGSYQRLFVSNIKDNKVFVGSDTDVVDFNYTVYAERKDVERLTVEY